MEEKVTKISVEDLKKIISKEAKKFKKKLCLEGKKAKILSDLENLSKEN